MTQWLDPSQQAGQPQSDEQARSVPVGENRAQVLVVSPKRHLRERMCAHLDSSGCLVRSVANISDARSMVRECTIDVALIDCSLRDGQAFDLCSECSTHEPGIVTILLDEDPSLEDALRAMRSGAIDLLPTSIGAADLHKHVSAGLDRAQHLRQRERRALKLRGLCLRLNVARQEVSRQVGELCSDLVGAYQDLSSQIEHISVSSELNSLLRQELDLESLLRTTLEYLLSKIGSTNAAIFLPSSSGEFTLGAYVNYDRNKEDAEVMLDHLASAFAPRFEGHHATVWLRDAAGFEAWLDDESHWLESCEAMVVPCHEAEECLAVLVAFRHERSPFTERDHEIIGVLGRLFGRQLARVISIHHRHLPKDKWGQNDDGL